MSFLLPPETKTSKGEVRKVGFEIEYGGLELDRTAQIITGLFGGTIQKKNNYSYKIKGTPYGDFDLESDARFLSEHRYKKYYEKIGLDDTSLLAENFEKVLEKLAGTLLPFEIAMPPLPMTDLEPAEKIRHELCCHSARGTRSSVFAAFGMQMNPEVPNFEATTLVRYMKSFFLLFDWLQDESDIVLARKIAPYIHPFPQEYVDLVLSADYQPSLQKFMDDYLEFNPTRNRPLDLLPLLAFIDRDRVMAHDVEHDLIKPRPTFHYRLPNSEIDDPTWSFAEEWNKWVEVEKLAFNPELLEEMSFDYRESFSSTLMFAHKGWVDRTKDWINAKT